LVRDLAPELSNAEVHVVDETGYPTWLECLGAIWGAAGPWLREGA
jgi:hypothetical protein